MQLRHPAYAEGVRITCFSDIRGDWHNGYCSITVKGVSTRYHFKVSGGRVFVLTDHEALQARIQKAMLSALFGSLGDTPAAITETLKTSGYIASFPSVERLILTSTVFNEVNITLDKGHVRLACHMENFSMTLTLNGPIADFLAGCPIT